MSSSYPPYYAYPSAPPLQRVLPKPPRLHWGWVLAISIITLGLFASVWLLVQAIWVRRMRDGKSAGFWLAVINLAWLPVVFCLAFGLGVANAIAPSATTSALLAALVPFVRLSSFALFVSAVFVLRSEMQAEPIGLSLSGGFTFLFAVVYFQYNLQDYGNSAPEGLSLIQSTPVSAPEPMRYPTAAEVGVVLPRDTAPERPPL